MRLLAFQILLLCFAGWGVAFNVRAVSLTRGPDVSLTSTNAVIRWTTDTESGSRVQFGVSLGRLDRRVQGAVGTEHTVELRELKPGTLYYFTAGTARVPLATNWFTTPNLKGPPDNVAITPAVEEPTSRPETNPGTQARPPPTQVTWGSARTLQDHFDRHGADFGARDPDDYAAQAWRFLVRAKAVGLPAKIDEDGVLRVFDAQSGAFAAYNRDGTTKTYFKPGRRRYFADQPGKSVDLRKLPDVQPPR